MIVEVKVARSWQVWIDGVSPDKEWEIGEGDGYLHFETTQGGQPLTIGPHRIEWIEFDTPNEDWVTDSNGVRLGPTEMKIKFVGKEPVSMEVTECWFLRESDLGPSAKGVKLQSGEWLEVDEIVAYVRGETEEVQK